MKTLPGTLTSAKGGPLLRQGMNNRLGPRGAPVCIPDGTAAKVYPRGVMAPGASVDGAMVYVLWDRPCGVHPRLEERHYATLHLDLTDTAGMDLAERWYALSTGRALNDVRAECWTADALIAACLALGGAS